MAPLRYAAKFDPFLSLDCAPKPSTLSQSKERKGSNFAIWQPCLSPVDRAEAALGEEGDLLELCAVTGVVVEGALGGRTEVGDTLGQVGAVDLPKTDVTL